MGKTVTFSFNSDKYGGFSETETFTFEEIGLDGSMDEKALQKEFERLIETWIWHKLNISWSVVAEVSDTSKKN